MTDRINQFVAEALPSSEQSRLPCFASANGFPRLFEEVGGEELPARIQQVTPRQMTMILQKVSQDYTSDMLAIFQNPNVQLSDSTKYPGNNAQDIRRGVIYKTGTAEFKFEVQQGGYFG